MTYFRRVADRTLSFAAWNIKPATTPQSIPESFQSQLREQAPFPKTWSMQSAPSNIPSDHYQSSETSQVSDQHLTPSPQPKSSQPPDKIQASHIDDSSPIPNNALEKASSFSQSKESHAHKVVVPRTTSMGNSTHQSDHQTVTAMPNKSPSSEKALQSDSQIPEFNKEGINSLSYNIKHPQEGQRHNRNDKAESQDNNNQSKSPQSVTDSKIVAVQKLQQAEEIPREPRPLNNSDSLKKKDYPHLQTNVSADKKYVPVQPALPTEKLVTKASSEKPEETVVTVNIGRIEIHSTSESSSGKRARPLKMEFSPSLSLAEYLKQRAERKSTSP